MKKILPLVAALGTVAVVSCGKDSGEVREAWNPVNDPLRLAGQYQRKLGQLPLTASLQVKPWSDTYWPTREGGIALRWYRVNTPPFSYQPYSEAQIRDYAAREPSRLASLSPAEKFDIVTGQFDYPTWRAERERTSPSAPAWEGLCHGWAPAAANFREPKPVTFVGPSGIAVPFGSSDVKALLTLYQGNISQAPARMLGGRCNVDLSRNPGARNNPECRDTNAGSFHIVLTNQIGLMNASFMADVTQDLEVWNQPVHGYSVRVVGYQAPSPGAAPGTVREAVVQSTMRYSVEVNPSYNPLGNADQSKTYQYRLELNGNDEIIGGEWISQDRPDFLWTQVRPRFTGKWQTLEALYTQSVGGTTNPTPAPTVTPMPPRPTPTATATPPRPTPTATATPPRPLPTATPPRPLPTATPPRPQPTFPPVDPVDGDWGNPGQHQCDVSQGWTLHKQQTSGGLVCAMDGWVQQGAITQQMQQECATQGGSDCGAPQWTVAQFAQFRGGSYCPVGTDMDKETGYCIEGSDLIGPFRKSLVDQCWADQNASGQDPRICLSPRLKKNYVLQTLGRR